MRRRIEVGIIGVLALGLVPTMAAADTQSEARSDLARARAASHQYHDAAVSEQDGFLATDECVELPGVGGMGFHYVKPSRIDSTLDIEQPEALLYAPRGNGGRRKLVGVEFIVPDADQDLSTDGDRPTLFGDAFDGPMPGHFPGMPVHYDQHVWIWQANPAGMFAEWNPNVHC